MKDFTGDLVLEGPGKISDSFRWAKYRCQYAFIKNGIHVDGYMLVDDESNRDEYQKILKSLREWEVLSGSNRICLLARNNRFSGSTRLIAGRSMVLRTFQTVSLAIAVDSRYCGMCCGRLRNCDIYSNSVIDSLDLCCCLKREFKGRFFH